MNNKEKPRCAQTGNPISLEIDWEFYRRFFYEIWEEKSLTELSDSIKTPSELSSESIDSSLNFNPPVEIFYSPNRNEFYQTSCNGVRNQGEVPFNAATAAPRPIEAMTQGHFQGDTTAAQENKSPERPDEARAHGADALPPNEHCTRFKGEQGSSRSGPTDQRETYPKKAPKGEAPILHFQENSTNKIVNTFENAPAGHQSGHSGFEERGKYLPLPKIPLPIRHCGPHYCRGITQIPGDFDPRRCRNNRRTSSSEEALQLLESGSASEKLDACAHNYLNKTEFCDEGAKFNPEQDANLFLPIEKDAQDKREENSVCLCEDEIMRLRQELQSSKSQIEALSLQMEDQSSHLQKLVENRRRSQQRKPARPKAPNSSKYPTLPGHSNSTDLLRPLDEHVAMGFPAYNNSREFYPTRPYRPTEDQPSTPFREGNSDTTSREYTGEENSLEDVLERQRTLQGFSAFLSNEAIRDPNVLSALKERFLALQMQNIHLSVSLRQEEQRREEVEANLEKERNYIKKLEDNIQNMRLSRVVMDPLTYREVADSYIASRKQPVRRTHTCMPCIGKSDLVCDIKSQDALTVRKHITSSFPSASSKKRATIREESEQISPGGALDGLSFETEAPDVDIDNLNFWSNEPANCNSSPLSQADYIKLLKSIENLNKTSPS